MLFRIRVVFLSLVLFGSFISLGQIANIKNYYYHIRLSYTADNDSEYITRLHKAYPKDTAEKRKLWAEHLFKSELNLVMEKRLPDVIQIGVDKCGNYALNLALKEHPMIKIPFVNPKAHYFDNAINGKEFYKSHMPSVTKYAKILEQTPAYFNWPPKNTPEVLHKLKPDLKIIILVCDPVERFLSDFKSKLSLNQIWRGTTVDQYLGKYMKKYGDIKLWERFSLNDAANFMMNAHDKDFTSTVLTTGLYYFHVSRWLNHFDRKNILIVDGGDLRSHSGQVIERIQDFIGVPKLVTKEDVYIKDNNLCFHSPWMVQAKCLDVDPDFQSVKIPEHWEDKLRNFYHPFNEKLSKLLETRFVWN